MDAPLTQRVLDPACGSGTFLFHAVRRLMRGAAASGMVRAAHPRSVRRKGARPRCASGRGDAGARDLVAGAGRSGRGSPGQADRAGFPGRRHAVEPAPLTSIGADVLVEVPGEPPLQIPAGLAEDQALFEQALDALNQGLADKATPETVSRALQRIEGRLRC